MRDLGVYEQGRHNANNGLGSPPTSQPTMLCYDEMKIDKFFQKGGYSNYRYREVRSKVYRFLNKEIKEDIFQTSRQPQVTVTSARWGKIQVAG